jgi:cytochrome c-type biogenesis protein CcmH
MNRLMNPSSQFFSLALVKKALTLLTLTTLAALMALTLLATPPASAQTAPQVNSQGSQQASPQTSPQARPIDENPVVQAQMREIANELRCVVCQNQNIADSNADLAVDLKNQIRSQLNDGKSKAEILDYMVARYGDFVLYRPPFKATTAVLWAGPFVLLAAALFILFVQIRRRRQLLSAEDFPGEDIARARELLNPGTTTKKNS